jgi:hypothetical protein
VGALGWVERARDDERCGRLPASPEGWGADLLGAETSKELTSPRQNLREGSTACVWRRRCRQDTADWHHRDRPLPAPCLGRVVANWSQREHDERLRSSGSEHAAGLGRYRSRRGDRRQERAEASNGGQEQARTRGQEAETAPEQIPKGADPQPRYGARGDPRRCQRKVAVAQSGTGRLRVRVPIDPGRCLAGRRHPSAPGRGSRPLVPCRNSAVRAVSWGFGVGSGHSSVFVDHSAENLVAARAGAAGAGRDEPGQD